MIFLRYLALLLATVGGAIALLTAAMTTWSVVGRAFFLMPITGDVELTTLGIGFSISMCLPWCQYQSSNILIDFFTNNLSESSIRRLDGIGSIFLSAMYLLLAWRTSVSALVLHNAAETSMILELPMWWTYAALAPGLTLAAVIAIGQAVRQLQGRTATPQLQD